MKGGSGLLTNKTVLIIVAILAAFNVIGYIMYNMTQLVIIYGIIAALTYMFSNKNMTLTLGVPLIVVNALIILHKQLGILGNLEGLEGMDASMNRIKAVAAKAKATRNDISTPVDPITEDTTTTTTATTTDETDVEPHTEEAFEGTTKKGRYRVDYASTIEDAYNELNTVLGSNGIKSLTNDTHNLMKKQLELAETMKTMGPLVQSMAPLLKQVQGLMGNTAGLPAVAPK